MKREINSINSVGSLYGSSPCYYITSKLREFDRILIIVKNNSEIYNLYDELLNFTDSTTKLDTFPNYEALPYDDIQEDKEILSSRIRCIKTITTHDKKSIVITNSHALLKKINPKLVRNDFFITINYSSSYNQIIDLLKKFRYEKTSIVKSHGEFSIKGPIIDIFPVDAKQPFRVKYDEDSIEYIKEFNADNQMTSHQYDDFTLCSSSEIILSDNDIARYKKNVSNKFDSEYLEDIEYEKITNNMLHPNLHNLVPLIYESKETFLNILNDRTLILSSHDIHEDVSKIYNSYVTSYNQQKYTRYLVQPDELLIHPDKVINELDIYKHLQISNFRIQDTKESYNETVKKLPEITINNKYSDPFKSLKALIDSNLYSISIFISKDSLRKDIVSFLNKNSFKYKEINKFDVKCNSSKINLVRGNITEGFIDFEEKIAVISSKDIFGKRAQELGRSYNKRSIDEYYNDISDLTVGSMIVHDDHGIGKYQGLINMNIEGIKTELLKIEYADNDILYIPVASIDLIKRFNQSSGVITPLHKLGGQRWHKVKKKAKQRINDLAVEILEIEAKRKLRSGFKFNLDIDEYQDFTDEFPFNETEDQIKTINSILSDMKSSQPMDRLICGDVGFGKTEIIMRASFVASMNNKQVVILAPTTILVEQHYKSFTKRFANAAVNICKLSRLEKPKKRSKIISDLADGTIDILIGTHAILSNEIFFKDLGLLIIDEEHKFGVRAKEKIKMFKGTIDIIAMTATPIPRTLNTALSKMRDISIIESPPENRKPIITEVLEWDNSSIINSINREIQRGGQIYFVHNNIKSINDIKILLEEMVPGIKIGVVHAKLDSKDIEIQMNKFVDKQVDLLICTSIIESGLDIPNVNTIYINNADKFGLSQLHQIRGRVGRSSVQAYAYLLIPNKFKISTESNERLETIDSINSLGGGLEIATRDLEIRGAGEILGQEQSGQLYEIGFAMFTDLLRKTITLLKNGEKEEYQNIVVDVNKPCLIPDDYIEDIYQRLKYYQKISLAKNDKVLQVLSDEFIDIYGPIPDELDNLMVLKDLKNNLKTINIKYMKISDNNISVTFLDKTNTTKEKNLLDDMKKINLTGDNKLNFQTSSENFRDQCGQIQSILVKEN